jgi:penicillin-insensitive murein endopeptidase
MRRSLVLVAAIAAAALTPLRPAAASFWDSVQTPSPGPAQSIGGSGAGCLAGGVALPADGTGYQAIRLSRRRYFGHPETVAFVERLGRADAAAGLPPFYVGDMAQPRGGPLPSMHVSHQSGIDVDIWFNLDPKPNLTPAAREQVELPSMILPDASAVDAARFGPRQVRLLRLAASDPLVERIFVHWTIKRALCEGYGGAGTGDRAWLHRLRPWYGHDDHFHVRLNCPPDSPHCTGQAPIPAGDGCDASLDWWFHQPPPSASPVPAAPPRQRPLPAACSAVEAAN